MDEEEPDISADGDKVEMKDNIKSLPTHCKFQRVLLLNQDPQIKLLYLHNQMFYLVVL